MNYNLLWGVWFSWALALLVYCLERETRWAFLIRLIKIAPVVISSLVILSLIRYLKAYKGLNMFKRKEILSENNNPQENPDSYIQPEPVQENIETVSTAVATEEKEATVIPSSCHIIGEIKASGDMRINGSINGTITAEKTVYVLREGAVEGEIHAEKVVVDGKVTGTCASATVEINANGLIDGTIESDDFSINKSGRFYGISKPRVVKKSAPEKAFTPVTQDSGVEKLTIIQQVLNNVPENYPK
jgi:cytoskeletal protein CcmA (bactofilin family)